MRCMMNILKIKVAYSIIEPIKDSDIGVLKGGVRRFLKKKQGHF